MLERQREEVLEGLEESWPGLRYSIENPMGDLDLHYDRERGLWVLMDYYWYPTVLAEINLEEDDWNACGLPSPEQW